MNNPFKIKKILGFFFSLLFLYSFPHCSSDLNTSASLEAFNLNSNSAWNSDQLSKLTKMIETYGIQSSHYNFFKKPVAIFDWDNTMIKNDVGDITVFWMIKNNKIYAPPYHDWNLSSSLLTPEAQEALQDACQASTNSEGQQVTDGSTPQSILCADEIISIYSDSKTTKNFPAFISEVNGDWIEPAYAWAVQLQAGYTPQEMRQFAEEAIAEALSKEIGAKQNIGSGTQNAYLRVYTPMKDLVNTLQKNGFDVWVVSASSQYLVEVFAEKYVGISKDHVIGVHPILTYNKIISPYFQGCGSQKDINQSIITYRQGKRCFINEIIFKIPSEKSLEEASPTVFAAGDSDTDLWTVRDASALKLVINRNKEELMCYAYENKDGKWLIHPMFIDPKPKRQHPYSCEKYGIQNQEDTVF